MTEQEFWNTLASLRNRRWKFYGISIRMTAGDCYYCPITAVAQGDFETSLEKFPIYDWRSAASALSLDPDFATCVAIASDYDFRPAFFSDTIWRQIVRNKLIKTLEPKGGFPNAER